MKIYIVSVAKCWYDRYKHDNVEERRTLKVFADKESADSYAENLRELIERRKATRNHEEINRLNTELGKLTDFKCFGISEKELYFSVEELS